MNLVPESINQEIKIVLCEVNKYSFASYNIIFTTWSNHGSLREVFNMFEIFEKRIAVGVGCFKILLEILLSSPGMCFLIARWLLLKCHFCDNFDMVGEWIWR